MMQCVLQMQLRSELHSGQHLGHGLRSSSTLNHAWGLDGCKVFMAVLIAWLSGPSALSEATPFTVTRCPSSTGLASEVHFRTGTHLCIQM